MSSKIYVGNLPYSVTDSSLKDNFAAFGSVSGNRQTQGLRVCGNGLC